MNWTQTREKLIAAGIDPARLPDEWKYSINLSGADLSGADLRGADLSGANLGWADLSGADLSRVDLSGADLSRADLRWANLSGADLGQADLSGANLGGADLRRVDLSGANLSGANLGGADLRRVDLSRADLSRATVNWNSHDLLAELARRAAGDDPHRRMVAGLILVSLDWRWDKFVAVFDNNTKDWLGSVFAPYVKDGDDAPDVVRQYAKAGVQR